jgi:hypothetical protein
VCGLWAAVRLSGIEPPWPAPALLALTPWAIPLCLLASAVAGIARNRWAAVVAAAAALLLAALWCRAAGARPTTGAVCRCG